MLDNAALKTQLSELGPSPPPTKFREVDDPLSWVFYSFSYIATSSKSKNVVELAGYLQIIIHTAKAGRPRRSPIQTTDCCRLPPAGESDLIFFTSLHCTGRE